MSMFQELDYNAEIQRVAGVQFSILSPDEIRRRSVAEIYTNETYDGDVPKVGGLFDPRMGVLDHGKKCPTDELDNRHCPGYFGHIELAKKVFHIHYLKYTIKCLQNVCWRCSKLLISPEDPDAKRIINNKKGVNRFLAITSLCSKIKRCGEKNEDGCGAIQPNIIKKEPSSIGKLTAEWKGDKKDDKTDSQLFWDADDVERILRRISDEEVEAMGFNKDMCRPEWLICSVLSVPPPSVRPSVRADNNTRMEDDLTHKLCDILKTNKILKQKIATKSSKKALDEWYQLLQYHVATLINNNLPGIPPAQQRSGRPLKSIIDRLKAKEGRVRGNLMGKRVDFSARSVITPDPRLKLNQLGVPYDICMNLTFPEKVNKFNKDKLTELVRNGYYKYPGAKSIKRAANGKMISLSVVDTSTLELAEGDIVNRHLIKGDIVLFNRQPSLHKMSMMQHEVVPLPYKTFRLNVSVTRPYNADFDGDEMNMHVPQSEQSRIELRELACVQSQIISPATHKPIISIVQDSLVGAYLFSRYDNYLTRNEIMDIMVDIPTFNGILPPPEIKAGTPEHLLPEYFPKYKYDTTVDLWNGRQIFSMIIPPVNLIRKNNSYNTDESYQNIVEITNGHVKSGVFDKNILGQSEQSLIHIIFNEFGQDRAQQFLDDMQNIVTNWVLKSGFSVGIGDLVPDKASYEKMQEIINTKKRNVIEIIEHVHKGILENNGGKTVADEFEQQVLKTLNGATTDTGKIALKHLDNSNRMLNMVNSGSKGSDINIGQMIACVGQQAVDGRRIPYGFTDRTLPHFHKYDDGASARGFVESSFMKGLTPTEFFFHAMGGREGLIDTAVKTSTSGYIQRKLIKALEDARISTDYTVRNANGTIVQFLYGEDGFDGAKIEKQRLVSINKSNDDIYKIYKINLDDDIENLYIPEIVADIRKNKMVLEEEMTNHINKIISDRDYYFNYVFRGDVNDEDVFAPVNIRRLVENASHNFPIHGSLSDLHPLYILQKIKYLDQNLKITETYKGNEVVIALAHLYLAPKVLLKEKINKIGFDFIVANIIQTFHNSIAHPGELVGTIAAQSMGEPTTQLTLNSVDWDTEIIISKNGQIITPMIGQFIDDYYTTCDKERVQHLENKQIYIDLNDGDDWKALSCDEDGIMKWTKLEAITRHPVVNLDGSDTILEVELESSRIIKATKAKSFLVYKDGKIVPIEGDKLVIGDLVPVANSIAIEQLPEKYTLNIEYMFPKTEYVYGSEVKKAINVMYQYEATGNRKWFKENNGKLFTVPFKRSDTFRDAYVNGRNTNAETIQEGCIYPLRTRSDQSHIPSEIPLDSEFGFFVGAYLAEGMSNETQVIISNNDKGYRDRVSNLMDKWNVGYHTVIQKDKNGPGWTSSDLRIHSTILSKLMGELFGKTCYVKRIPAMFYQAPHEFIVGLVDGYISGDGCVSVSKNKIYSVGASSTSKKLLEDMCIIFARYNIFCTIHSYSKHKPDVKNGFNTAAPSWEIRVCGKSREIFANYFSCTIDYKQERLNDMVEKGIRGSIKYNSFNNVVLDKVKSIREIKPMCEWVYDLTVAETRNFVGKNLANLADTFHFAGVASKSNVNQGVPRLNELFSISRNLKSPNTTIILKEPYCYNKEYSQKILNELAITTIKQLTNSTEIYFDIQSMSNFTSEIEEDADILEIYKEFAELDKLKCDFQLSPWVLRIKLDKMKMMDKNIRMSDIHYAIISKFNMEKTNISCVFADDNSSNLILRIQSIIDQSDENDDCDEEDMICILKTLEKTILNDITLTGIKNIKAVSMYPEHNHIVFNNETKEFSKKTQWILSTDGNNLEDILIHPSVDPYNTYSNDIYEIYETLGIEAARQVLFNEIFGVFQFNSAYVNARHVNLLVDVMTNRGTLMSIDRHGINKSDRGPLAKCSFEETPDIIARAAIFGELDKVKSVSSNIMLGQEVPIGTGSIDVIFDEEKFFETISSIPPEIQQEEEMSITERDTFTSRYCDALF